MNVLPRSRINRPIRTRRAVIGGAREALRIQWFFVNGETLKRLNQVMMLIGLGLMYATLVGTAVGQESEPLRRAADDVYLDELQRIIKWCQDEGLAEQARATLAQNALARDPGRQYIFLPTATVEPLGTPTDKLQEWEAQVTLARQKYAESLLKVARTLAEQEQGAEAYQLIHEALYWSPELAGPRQALGHRKTSAGWQPYSDQLSIQSATKAHRITQWPAGSYFVVVTDDFEIASNADEAATQRMAERLQRWQWVWRQVFFDYWANGKKLLGWLDGKPPSSNTKKFQVVFFKDRASYNQVLAPLEPGIEATTGYYSDRLKTSFFSNSPELDAEETWRHELTHQLFKETVRTESYPFEEGYLWIGEGIAMYMESLRDFGPFVTLGGFDGRRLQFARARRLRENFQIPVAELNAMSRVALQKHPEIRRIYSESAGLCHFLMNGEGNRYRRNFVELMSLIYRGKLKPGKFAEVLGITPEQIEVAYPQFLTVDSDTIVQMLLAPQLITELTLPNCPLELAAFSKFGTCSNLQSLDVSGNQISRQSLESLAPCQKLEQLFLSACQLEPGTLQALSSLPTLTSLDLARTNIDAVSLRDLSALPNLTILSLAHTQLNDQAVPELVKLSNLRVLSLNGSGITEAGKQQLRRALPNLKIVD